ncbi:MULTISPECIES: SseB family protein [Demequina]|uniref:SseB family protein n=1 Tax=Demequina TaxID=577469 RepID=UPI00078215B9|nr:MULTISPECIES: SseB family protein [Demequina]
MNLPDETLELESLIKANSDKGLVVDQLLRSVVVVPVDVNVGDDSGNVTPVTVDRDGHSNVLAFTTAEGFEQMRSRTPNAITIPATSLILNTPDGFGLLLFSSVGNVALDPSVLHRIRTDLRALGEPTEPNG